jgi:ribonuclease III
VNLTAFQNKIGYQFRNIALLEKSLTHSSYYRGKSLGVGKDNERLEFLGDAFLDAVIGESLYHRLPEGEEGKLSKLRALVVCEIALSRVARELGIGEILLLGYGEEQSGGRNRDSILADATEALIGAVYLDGGFEHVKQMILRIFEGTMQEAIEGRLFSDYKSEFQELIQLRRAGDNIEYVPAGSEGPDHDKTFHVELTVNGEVLGQGTGKSKKEAEQNAARQAIEKRGDCRICTSKE